MLEVHCIIIRLDLWVTTVIGKLGFKLKLKLKLTTDFVSNFFKLEDFSQTFSPTVFRLYECVKRTETFANIG